MGKAIKWVNILAYISMVTINILANTIPIGGLTTRQVSDMYPTLFTPAAMTFSIWGIIYLLMAIFVLSQLTYSHKDSWLKIGPWFLISCLFNIAWILSWHNLLINLSTIMIVGLLLSLLLLDNRLYQTDGLQVIGRVSSIGIELYIGWITAATIANIAVTLVKNNWSGMGIFPEYWTALALLIGSIIGALYVSIRQRYFSGIAIIWAYIGILYKHTSAAGYHNRYPFVAIFALVGIFIILITIVRKLIIVRAWHTVNHNSP